jgi:hypothetical protein
MSSVSNSLRSYLVDFSDKANPFNAMNVDIGFSEGQYGLLASVAFTSLFAVASLGAGIASDRSNRKVLTVHTGHSVSHPHGLGLCFFHANGLYFDSRTGSKGARRLG